MEHVQISLESYTKMTKELNYLRNEVDRYCGLVEECKKKEIPVVFIGISDKNFVFDIENERTFDYLKKLVADYIIEKENDMKDVKKNWWFF